MSFAISMVWREQKDHSTDCYNSNIMCITQISCFPSKSKHRIKSPNTPSTIRPVPHDGILPVPKPLVNWSLEKSEESSNGNDLPSCKDTFL